MKKVYLIIPLLILVLLIGCKNDELFSNTNSEITASWAGINEKALPGIIYVEVSDNLADVLARNSEHQTTRSIEPISDELFIALGRLDAVTLEPLFPPNSKFEQRRRKCGLHKWYRIIFDKNKDLSEAYRLLEKVYNVQTVEPAFPVSLAEENTFGNFPITSSVMKVDGNGHTDNGMLPFNDPLLPQQWYLHNDGKNNSKSVVGADINVFDAWKITTGKPNVIVAVLDQAVDYTHEDLKQSMWINMKEKNGMPGVDDDNNGYIDDIYGVNFTSQLLGGKEASQYDFGSSQHGTHVAGIIAARNNNGIGMCGIAGGDGTPDSGVRIMGLQTIGAQKESGHIAQAFYYATDNGAVITNNSWKIGEQPLTKYLQNAIDYFIDYAGCDDRGNQLPDSPMKGGLAVFASGNDASIQPTYPAAYERVLAVTSAGLTLKRASYSNVGAYVDICAFGGDPDYDGYNSDIISTVPMFEERDGQRFPVRYSPYLPKHGTSQATPQVAGVAALVVSAMGKQGFTAMELREILLKSIRPFDIDEYNPQEKGLMGVGYIDATLALKSNKNIPPESSQCSLLSVNSNSIELGWKISADEDDGAPFYYNIYYSTSPLFNGDYKNAHHKRIFVYGKEVDSKMSYTIEELKGNTKYYFALLGEDRWGLLSEPTFTQGVTRNYPPVVTGVPKVDVEVFPQKNTVINLDVSDPDGHLWNYKMTPMKGINIERIPTGLRLYLTAALPDKYNRILLSIIDEVGDSTEVLINAHVNEFLQRETDGHKDLPIKNIKSKMINRFIEIELADYVECMSYSIYDRHGRNVLVGKVSNIKNGQGIIDLNDLVSGIYKINIEALGTSLSSSFIKK